MKLSKNNKILEEFQKSNFQKSYDLAINLNHKQLNESSLKILAISSFNLQKYSESIKYGIKLYENYNITNDLQLLNILGTSYSIIKDYAKGNYFSFPPALKLFLKRIEYLHFLLIESPVSERFAPLTRLRSVSCMNFPNHPDIF